MTEEGVARLVNVLMVSVLGALALAFVAWLAVTEFIQVRQIYLSLSPQAQGHVSRFAGSVFWLIFILTAGLRFSRKATGPSQGAAPTQVP